MTVEDINKNKKRREEAVQLLKDNLQPRGKPGVNVTIEKLVVVLPGIDSLDHLLKLLQG